MLPHHLEKLWTINLIISKSCLIKKASHLSIIIATLYSYGTVIIFMILSI